MDKNLIILNYWTFQAYEKNPQKTTENCHTLSYLFKQSKDVHLWKGEKILATGKENNKTVTVLK